MSVGVVGGARRTVTFLREVLHEVIVKEVPFLAKSVAFSAFVSLLPLLLLSLIVAVAVGGEAFADRIIAATQEYLTPAAQGLVTDALTRAESRLQFSVLGLGVLLWGVLGVFRGLDKAFSLLYDAPSTEGFLGQLTDALVVLAAIVVATVAVLGAALALAWAPDHILVDVVGSALLIVGLAIAFFPLFYVFPDVDVSVAEVVPGALVAAVGWTLLQAGFQFYVAASATNRLYGAIGGVILLLTFLYLGALVLLVGCAVNVVLAGRHRARTAPRPT